MKKRIVFKCNALRYKMVFLVLYHTGKHWKRTVHQ